MKTERKHKHEEKPWQPTIERSPEFNPFVNPLDRTGQLENPPPLEDIEAEEEAVEDARVARKARGIMTPVAQITPPSVGTVATVLVEPAVRLAMIAQEAYFLSERRGFCPGGELGDWLSAEAQVDRTLRSEQAVGPAIESR